MKGLRTRKRRPPGTRRFGKRQRPGSVPSFEAYLDLLRAYVARTGHARVPIRHRERNFALGRYVTRCRRRYREGDLSPERIRILERLPRWSWDPVEDRHSEALAALQLFAKRHGHTRVPMRYRHDDLALGAWVRTRRREHGLGSLSPARVAALERLAGWSWDRREDDFRHGLRILRRFVRREGHAGVPDLHVEAGFALGSWVRNRRRERRLGILRVNRERMLQRLPGWRWDQRDEQFQEGLRRVERFARREGHVLVPARHVERGFPLGSWVNNRRAEYRRNGLSAERIRLLEALPGWKWNLRRLARPDRRPA